MDFYGLNEVLPADAADTADDVERARDASATFADNLERADAALEEEMDAPVHIEALVDASEAAYDAGMSIKEICDFIEQHLGLKMGDFTGISENNNIEGILYPNPTKIAQTIQEMLKLPTDIIIEESSEIASFKGPF